MLDKQSRSHSTRSVYLKEITGGALSYGLCEGCGAPRYEHRSLYCGDTCRFWSKVRKGPDCWLWTGARKQRADRRQREWYGQFATTVNGKQVNVGAHRYAWELEHGPIPEGKSCLHHCDDSICVRVEHLYIGDQGDNMKDAQARGRLHVDHPSSQKLTQEQIDYIRIEDASGGRGTRSRLARELGVSKTYITLVCQGTRRQYDAPLVTELEQAG